MFVPERFKHFAFFVFSFGLTGQIYECFATYFDYRTNHAARRQHADRDGWSDHCARFAGNASRFCRRGKRRFSGAIGFDFARVVYRLRRAARRISSGSLRAKEAIGWLHYIDMLVQMQWQRPFWSSRQSGAIVYMLIDGVFCLQ